MDNIEKNILKIQNWYRNTVKLKLHIISRINFDIDNLYHLIFSTMDRIQNNFINGIFSQNKYNTYMIQLDNIYDKFQSLPRPLTIKEYASIGEENMIRRISDIKLELIYICKNSGMKNILDIVNLVVNLTITDKIENYKFDNCKF